MNPVLTYQKLKRVAEASSASETERSTARARMAKLVATHGQTIFDIKRFALRPESPHEAQLILHVAGTMGLTVEQGAGFFTLVGHPDKVDQAVGDLRVYSVKLGEILHVAMMGALKGFGVYYEPPKSRPVEPVKPVEKDLATTEEGAESAEGTDESSAAPTPEEEPNGPKPGDVPLEEKEVSMPYAVQHLISAVFQGSGGVARHWRRADYTLKQLPAGPKKPQPFFNTHMGFVDLILNGQRFR